MSLITPLPRHANIAATPHRLPTPENVRLHVPAPNTHHIEGLSQHLASVLGVPATSGGSSVDGFIIRCETPEGQLATDLEPATITGQEYHLTVSVDEIVITSTGVGGWHHGISALASLVHAQDATWDLWLGTVNDAPDLPWRGLSMDIARSFFPLAELMVIVDLLASYRFNVLHLHLTDDQGWRLESSAYPALGRAGGVTAVDGGRSGLLTHGDYAELQDYAAARGITVVPEIDIPGHTNAALHALPELNKDGRAAEIYTGVEVGFSRIHTDVSATMPFLTAVFTELAAMTDGRYIHFGGDEALQVPGEDYATLVESAIAIISAAGKVPVGWQEIAAANLSADTIMQLWDRRKNPPEIARHSAAGRRSILSPSNRTYLDMSARPGQGIGVNWDVEFSLHDAYDWDPRSAVEGLAPDTVMGLEVTMWTETVHNFDTLTTLLLPRLVATAEVGWTAPDQRDWDHFRSRMLLESQKWALSRLSFDHEDIDGQAGPGTMP